jgi:hypothetical protein
LHICSKLKCENLYSITKRKAGIKKGETAKHSMAEWYLWNSSSKTTLHLPTMLVTEKSCPVFTNVSKSLKNLRFDVWLAGENKSFNMEFYRE